MGFRDFNDPIRDLARAAEMHYDEERYMAGADKEEFACEADEDLRKEKLGHVEPAPTPNDGPSMHDLVIEDMAKRKEFGLAKYGTLLQAGNGRDALMDAYEEVLDLAVYLRQAIEERYPQRYVKGLDTEVSGDES